MKTIQTTCLLTVIALTLACGYSAKTTPPAAGTMPAIAQLNPDNATAGGSAFTLTVNGSNFASNATVNWNGTAQTATTYVSGNQLTVMIPATLIENSATVQVTVTNPGNPGTGIYGTGATLAETSTSVSFAIN